MEGDATTRKDTVSGLLSIGAVAIVWGTIPLLLRAADGASVVKVFYRVLFGGLVLIAYMAASGRLREITSLPKRKLLQLAGQGILLTLNWLCFFSALDLTNVATVELLGYTGPVFVAALAPFISRERFDPRIVVPLLLALGGIVVILAPSGIRVSSSREMLGAALAFASALLYATTLLRAKKILRGVTGSALMVVEYTVATLMLLPFVVWLYANGQGLHGGGSYAALATLGVVHTAGTGLVFLSALRRVRTDHAAVLTYAEPVSAVLFAAAFLGEALQTWTIVGGLMVVAGGALVTRLQPSFGPETAGAENAESDGPGAGPVG